MLKHVIGAVATLVVLALSAAAASASADDTPRCPGSVNTIPVHTDAPTFLRSVPTGKAFLGGNGTDAFYVLHMYGTPYEMGLAHGQLFADEIPIGLNRFYDWVEGQIETILPWLPAYVAGLVADFGTPIALEWTWNNTKPFTNLRYYEEMNGIADGAGVARQDIYNINMIAELIKAQCSIVGANGAATIDSLLRGGLTHLRTLDGMGGSTMPIKDYAAVFVYHPSDATPPVAVFGWLSFVGCVTGFGSHVGIGEKYWGNHSEAVMSVHGQAWTFVTRDILASMSFEGALSTLADSNRTCAVHLGIGASGTNRFVGVETAAHALTYFNASSIDYPEHPVFPGIVYWDKYAQPTTSYCFADLFRLHYGAIDAAVLALQVAPLAETGSLHAAVFDYPNRLVYFANARKSNATDDGMVDAYGRQFTVLNMSSLFAESLSRSDDN